MKSNRPQFLSNVLIYYFVSGVIESMVALIVLMLFQPDPKNAWLFGFSKTRLATALGLLLVTGLFTGLSAKAWRDRQWLQLVSEKTKSWVDELGWFLPVIWLIFIMVFFAPYLYLLGKPAIHPTIGRLIPVLALCFIRCLQTMIALLIFRSDIPYNHSWEKQDEFILEIKPLKVAVIFAIISILMILINISVNVVDYTVRDENLLHYTQKLYVDYERNIPTYYSSILLWTSAFLIGVVAALKKRERASFVLHWTFLALLFIFFSMDEVAGVHEMMNRPIRWWLHPQGVFSFQWVVLGIPLVVLFFISYIRFFLHLPKKFKWLFSLSALFYVGGALGFEMIGAGYEDVNGKENLIYAAIATVEETLEMIGLPLFIYTLLEYIADNYSQVKILLLKATTADIDKRELC